MFTFIVFGRPGCKRVIYLGDGYVHACMINILAQAAIVLEPPLLEFLKNDFKISRLG